MRRRSRSRSRSPVRTPPWRQSSNKDEYSTSPWRKSSAKAGTPPWRKSAAKSTVTPQAKSAVNMLDPEAVELSRNNRSGEKNFVNRITCTIPGNGRGRGRMTDRMSGGSYGDRRVVSMGGNDSFRGDGFNRNRGRGGIHNRITHETPKHRMQDNDDAEDNKNGSFLDPDKPVQRLVDPTFVPKGRGFFDHDDRGGSDSKWRGRTSYDPRIDFGSRRGRGGRHSWNDRRSDDRRRDDRSSFTERRSRNDKSFDRSFDRSRAEGMWTHDKYMEIQDDSGPSEGVEVVVDQGKESARKVHESD